jgi:hypothetical protein
MLQTLRKLKEWFSPTPKTPEQLAAQQEAARLRAEIKAQRLGEGRRR